MPKKNDKTTTVTITRQDGTTKSVEILDGEKGEKGDTGEPGQIKMLVVNELPTIGETGTLYFVPKEDVETSDLYYEYVYINNAWELLGEKQIVIDLTNYVKYTDYATTDNSGVIKVGTTYKTRMTNDGFLYAISNSYNDYLNGNNNIFISKGTLENVITGKGLVSNTDYASSSTGGVIKSSLYYNTNVNANGYLIGMVNTFNDYSQKDNASFISKGTLENVITGKDLTTKTYVDGLVGDIDTALDTINGEVVS